MKTPYGFIYFVYIAIRANLAQIQTPETQETLMVRASIAFFLIGLLALVLGANNIAGMSIEVGKLLLYVFLVLAVVSFLFTLVTGKKTNILP